MSTTNERAARVRERVEQTRLQGRQTIEQATKASAEARATALAALRDGAYATLGAGDAAADVARSLAARADALRDQVGDAAEREALRKRAQDLPQHLRTQAGREVTELAERGRIIVGAVREQEATKVALARTRTARRQVKAASTSVQKAVKAAVDGFEAAAGTIGVRR